VYVLASHSHFIMDDVFRTPYWGDHVLAGWIVGTAESFATDCLQHSAKSSSPNRRLRIPVGLGLRRGVRNI
jgi:hypothetical protein